jgi:hypothetical protein
LTPGVTYGFKVQSRNAFGLSEDSAEFFILCGTVPDAPVAPTTTTVASDVIVTWTAPNNNGSPITGYKIYLQGSGGSYIEEATHCPSSSTLVTARSCTIPLTSLIATPYSLSLGDSVYAKIIASN